LGGEAKLGLFGLDSNSVTQIPRKAYCAVGKKKISTFFVIFFFFFRNGIVFSFQFRFFEFCYVSHLFKYFPFRFVPFLKKYRFLTPGINHKDIHVIDANAVIKKWFNFAQDRLSKRKSRNYS
jgi:hypothetical protein